MLLSSLFSIDFLSLAIVSSIFIVTTNQQLNAAAWGSIDISENPLKVTFQNDKILATYENWGSETVIKKLYAKGNLTNIAGNCIDACASRKKLTAAKIIDEKEDRITAELNWGGQTVSHITLYKSVPVLKIDQIKGGSPNIVDATNGFKEYMIYGMENWKRPLNKYPKCYYYSGDKYCADQNGEANKNDDPKELLYKNWFITGLYKSQSEGIGYGRVIDSKVKILKLLDWGGRGFEYFWNNHVAYLYVVTGGKKELNDLGKAITDWAVAGEMGLPGTGSSVVLRQTRRAGIQLSIAPVHVAISDQIHLWQGDQRYLASGKKLDIVFNRTSETKQ